MGTGEAGPASLLTAPSALAISGATPTLSPGDASSSSSAPRPITPTAGYASSSTSVTHSTFNTSPMPSPPCGAAFLRRLHTDPSATHVTLPPALGVLPNDLASVPDAPGTPPSTLLGRSDNSPPPPLPATNTDVSPTPLLPLARSPPPPASPSTIPSPAVEPEPVSSAVAPSSVQPHPTRPPPMPLQPHRDLHHGSNNVASPSPILYSSPADQDSSVSPRGGSLQQQQSSGAPSPAMSPSAAAAASRRNDDVTRFSSFQEHIDGQPSQNGNGEPGAERQDRAASFAARTESQHELNADLLDHQRASWNDFAIAYCNGRFDPLRIPNPPNFNSSIRRESNRSGVKLGFDSAPKSAPSLRTRSYQGQATRSDSITSGDQASQTLYDSDGSAQARPRPRPRPPNLNLPEYKVAAATVRIASSNLPENVLAPLGVPSPERELLDPLASIIGIPVNVPKSPTSDPSSSPVTSSFVWGRSKSNLLPASSLADSLPTIQGSPANTPSLDKTAAMTMAMSSLTCGNVAAAVDPPTPPPPPPVTKGGALEAFKANIPPASAPLPTRQDSVADEDYFNASPAPVPENTVPIPVPHVNAYPLIHHPHEVRPFFEKYGFLPSPMPPREADRRKALYSFNILHTAGDLNFDRIVHMIKLVFNTRMAFLSLIDSDQQWYKSQIGFGGTHSPRVTGICGHTLLVDSDEPFVVLDTHLDWRFAKNPHVTGPPNIRFYAGTPLRTSDGLNLGSLCLVDDRPRTEFTPRSRHILKEFAAIVMRELELWRDKLQLRTRDKIQTSMEKFTRECLEIDDKLSSTNFEASSRMTQVYQRAAKLVHQTLDLDGCAILDISQFERVEVDLPDGTHKVVYHANPYHESQSVLERVQTFGPVTAFPVLASTPGEVCTRDLTPLEHERMSVFLGDQRDGRIFENIAPSWIRYIFPSSLKYGMVVPVIGIDGQPFALICAHTHDKGKQFLEGYELQFLRAIGVIILSAVLRRRMILADRSKSVLISSVSHELRTPLHGILAATELLNDSPLDTNQTAFLSTVKTCGMQLIETVNHVLDFTKLRSEKDNGGRRSAHLTEVDLADLVEQTVESCYVGQRSRYMQLNDDQLGSFYSPSASRSPYEQRVNLRNQQFATVESVVDIGLRPTGWKVMVDTGSLRRIVMNLYGNSLKFTKQGFVQVSLRALPHAPDATRIPIEITVVDTGKGIGKSFLKDQLFEPFTQENPLQPGTGLGLAIVNSIVRSDVVQGNVDVWSAEGVGTEIKVSCEVELAGDPDDAAEVPEYRLGAGFKVAFLGFDLSHRGLALVREVVGSYAMFMGLTTVEDPGDADLLMVNEFIKQETEEQYRNTALILIATFKKSDAEILAAMGRTAYTGLLNKPVGAAKVIKEIKSALKWLKNPIRANSGLVAHSVGNTESDAYSLTPLATPDAGEENMSPTMTHDPAKARIHMPLVRRRSDERAVAQAQARPPLAPRGLTYHAVPEIAALELPPSNVSSPNSTVSAMSTISLADGGAMLKAAARPEISNLRRPARVLVVEDNVINRRVLTAFLKKRGFEHAEAVNGADGVELFDKTPPNYWDVLLMDITMPVMNGYEATRSIRRIESSRRRAAAERLSQANSSDDEKVAQARTQTIGQAAKIFALTGLATDSDKRQAFDSGVDGYLVKPVSLASLDLLFTKIGF